MASLTPEEFVKRLNTRSEAEQIRIMANVLKQYETLSIRVRDLQRENERYAARIRELEQKDGTPMSQHPEPLPDAGQPPAKTTVPTGSVPYRISTCTEELEKYPDTVFAAPTSSMITGMTVLNKAPFRRAPLVIINEKAYLNPHFFRSLKSGTESCSSFTGLDSVFEIEGLGGNTMTYGLGDLTPAEVSHDAAADTYRVEQPGKLVLHIG